MTAQRLIKKYPNRRLYDTETCLYITLDDIKKLVLQRIEFKVIDARSKKDLTQVTLLQIITDQEATTPLFTINILQDFIRFYHEKTQDSFSRYLEQALSLFNQQKHFFEDQWNSYQHLLLKSMSSDNASPKNKKPKKPKSDSVS